MRLFALMVLRSHLLAGLALGPYAQSEVTLSSTLWPRLPARSLLIMDRGFASYAVFDQLADSDQDRHWLTRLGRLIARLELRLRSGGSAAAEGSELM